MTHATTFARLASVVMLACATGAASGQNVGSYGMATKPPPPNPETLQSLTISEETQKKVLGTTLPLDGTFYDHTYPVTKQGVTLREVIGGKPTILVPVYFRCPRLCSETIENLLIALRQMRATDGEMTPGQAFNLVFFSIDDHEHPLIATPRRDLFHKELDGRSADESGVWFLSANSGQFGDPAVADQTIHELTDAIGFHFVKADRKGREIQHPTAVLVLTPTGAVSSYNTQLAYDAKDLAGQIRTAGRGETGSTSSVPSLACFLGDTDPNGWYAFTMRILGWAALPAVVAAGAVVWVARARAKAEKTQRPAGEVEPPAA